MSNEDLEIRKGEQTLVFSSSVHSLSLLVYRLEKENKVWLPLQLDDKKVKEVLCFLEAHLKRNS